MAPEAATQRPTENRTYLWLSLLLGAVAMQVVLWRISEPSILFSDFYKAYYPAAELVWRAGRHATWRLDGASAIGFVNIPIVAWLFVPLLPFGEQGAGWAFVALGVAAAAGAWALLVRLGRPEARSGAPLLFLFLVNGPLVNSLREGNTTHLVLLMLVVALLWWRAGSDFAAGMMLGACAVIKPPLLLYGVYFTLRRRWRLVAGGATAIGATVLLSLAIFGPEINIGWYRSCVEPFLSRFVPAFNVQSIDGFLLRLKTGGDYLLYWEPVEPTVIHKFAREFVFAAMLGGAFWLMRRADAREPMPAETGTLSARDLLEYALVLNLALVMSPLSWTHYYLLLLLPWGLYLGGLLPLPDDATTRWLMWSSALLSSLPVVIVPLQPGWFEALAARTAVSAWLFGGLLMLGALARGAWQATQPYRPSTRTIRPIS